MPGVPPDAVAQVKKGLRGLFNRRKSKQGHNSQSESSSTIKDTPTSTTTATAAAPATFASATTAARTGESSAPSPPQPAIADPNKAPQLSEPSRGDLAKDIDLNPSPNDVKPEAPTAVAGHSQAAVNPSTDTMKFSEATPEASKPTTESLKAATEPSAALTEPTKPLTESTTGMSATSGPLGDHMAEAYVDDDDFEAGPKRGSVEKIGEKTGNLDIGDEPKNVAEEKKME